MKSESVNVGKNIETTIYLSASGNPVEKARAKQARIILADKNGTILEETMLKFGG